MNGKSNKLYISRQDEDFDQEDYDNSNDNESYEDETVTVVVNKPKSRLSSQQASRQKASYIDEESSEQIDEENSEIEGEGEDEPVFPTASKPSEHLTKKLNVPYKVPSASLSTKIKQPYSPNSKSTVLSNKVQTVKKTATVKKVLTPQRSVVVATPLKKQTSNSVTSTKQTFVTRTSPVKQTSVTRTSPVKQTSVTRTSPENPYYSRIVTAIDEDDEEEPVVSAKTIISRTKTPSMKNISPRKSAISVSVKKSQERIRSIKSKLQEEEAAEKAEEAAMQLMEAAEKKEAAVVELMEAAEEEIEKAQQHKLAADNKEINLSSRDEEFEEVEEVEEVEEQIETKKCCNFTKKSSSINSASSEDRAAGFFDFKGEKNIVESMLKIGFSAERCILIKKADGSLSCPYILSRTSRGHRALVSMDLNGHNIYKRENDMMMERSKTAIDIPYSLRANQLSNAIPDTIGISFFCKDGVCIQHKEQGHDSIKEETLRFFNEENSKEVRIGDEMIAYPVIRVSQVFEDPERVSEIVSNVSFRIYRDSYISGFGDFETAQATLRDLQESMNTLKNLFIETHRVHQVNDEKSSQLYGEFASYKANGSLNSDNTYKYRELVSMMSKAFDSRILLLKAIDNIASKKKLFISQADELFEIAETVTNDSLETYFEDV